jgi:hypothetical protein
MPAEVMSLRFLFRPAKDPSTKKFESAYQGRRAPFSLQRYPRHRIGLVGWRVDDVSPQARRLQRTRR